MTGVDHWRPKLVALDVDGTIVDYDHFFNSPTSGAGLSLPVIEAVGGAREQGAHVVLATGRAWHSTARVAHELSIGSGYAVCSNGAIVIDVASSAPVHTATFDAAAPVSYFAEHIPDAVLAVEDPHGGFRVTGEFPVAELDGNAAVVDHDNLLTGEVSRLVVRWPNGDRLHLRDIAKDAGLPSVDYAIGHSAWLDIMPKGVSKAKGLEVVCGLVGVDVTDVLAVGDGHNDTDMLEWAGLGVAMGQAPDDVKAAADEVCGDVTDDGAAALLDRYFSTP